MHVPPIQQTSWRLGELRAAIFVHLLKSQEEREAMNRNKKQALSTWAITAALIVSAAAPLAAQDVIYTYAAPGGNHDIVRNTNGQATMLTNSPGMDAEATQSPDGTWIIFTSERTGRPQLYKMGSDGSSPSNISSPLSDESQASFSPDGEWISFVSQAAGDGASIFSSDPAGQDRQRLTNSGPTYVYSEPQMSPDGTRRIFNCEFAVGGGDTIII